ncbi:13981_t:CDS:2, partial [Entrophospora sp. SA101]
MGAFGLVCSAKDQLKTTNVAIKKILKPFSTPVLAKRTFREFKLLKQLKHENIISLNDVFISPLEDIYFVTELLETDLHQLLTSYPLEKQFIQYFLYQILRGLKYVHSAVDVTITTIVIKMMSISSILNNVSSDRNDNESSNGKLGNDDICSSASIIDNSLTNSFNIEYLMEIDTLIKRKDGKIPFLDMTFNF